ncbi:MAG: SMP-30/gluconolactonase/LRE family protein [Thermoanaerobaculales bacterium]|nr:SMP-30/gluconolactonase/LRE family protein [Thermoanaerobaculales bacterium]
MRNALRLAVLIVLFALSFGCPHENPSEPPVIVEEGGRSVVAFQLPERDLIPEGICYDPEEDVFYLGSIRKSKILKISRDGEVETFVPPTEGEDRGYLGMRIDLNQRVLWANWHQDLKPNDPDPERQLWTGIAKFDLEDGHLIREYLIEKTGENHLFNDVAIARDGTVYFTSFSYGMIYAIDSVTDEIEEFLQMPDGVWNNGIDITPDDKYLFVVGSDRIFRVDLETKEFLELPAPEDEIVGWGDGLYFNDGNLLAITGHREGDQVVNRVLRLHLSEALDRITKIEVLDQDHPLYSNPTTGAVADDWFYYIATAQFEKFDEEGNLAPWEELSDTYILKLRLE